MRNHVRKIVLAGAIGAAAVLSSCASGTESLNVRVRNHAAHNLRVKSLGGASAGNDEVVYPGAFSRAHAPEVMVYAPDKGIRISAARATVLDGADYKYRHITLGGLGRKDLIFEVMVDNEGLTWAYRKKDGERVRFPAEIVARP